MHYIQILTIIIVFVNTDSLENIKTFKILEKKYYWFSHIEMILGYLLYLHCSVTFDRIQNFWRKNFVLSLWVILTAKMIPGRSFQTLYLIKFT